MTPTSIHRSFLPKLPTIHESPLEQDPLHCNDKNQVKLLQGPSDNEIVLAYFKDQLQWPHFLRDSRFADIYKIAYTDFDNIYPNKANEFNAAELEKNIARYYQSILKKHPSILKTTKKAETEMPTNMTEIDKLNHYAPKVHRFLND